MNTTVRSQIKSLIRGKLITKIENYSPDSDHKPFFTSLFSEEKIVSASLIHSFYTSFGMSIYEQLAVLLSQGAGYHAERQHILVGDIDLRTEQLIDTMWEESKNVGCKNKLEQIEQIRSSIYPARSASQHNDSIVDLFIRTPNNQEYYIDIKTVKPNKEAFHSFKRKLLRWAGYRFSMNRDAQIGTYIAIPYNPYHPTSYLDGMRFGKCMDAHHDILAQEQFWNLVGGENTTYTELLNIFQEIGQELSQQIQERFG